MNSLLLFRTNFAKWHLLQLLMFCPLFLNLIEAETIREIEGKGETNDRVNTPKPPSSPVTTKSEPPIEDLVYNVSINGTDCIRAIFKVNLSVEYACTRVGRAKPSSACTALLALPDPSKVSVSGRCGPEPILILRWSEKRLSLTFKFSKHENEWFADHLDFSFDPKDEHFPHASETHRKVLSAEESLRLFKSPINRSFTCNSTIIIDLGLGTSRHAGVTVTDSQVQVYELPSRNKQLFSEPYDCPADFAKPRSPITAFVIASCLALLVILIIAGYYFSRKSNPSPYATVD